MPGLTEIKVSERDGFWTILAYFDDGKFTSKWADNEAGKDQIVRELRDGVPPPLIGSGRRPILRPRFGAR